MNKTQIIRHTTQAILLILLFVGLHRTIHPALIIFLPLALIAGNFFCGWICPFGTVQESLSKIGSLFVKKKLKLPRGAQRYAQYSRYLLMLLILILLAAGAIHPEQAGSLPFDGYQSFYAIFDKDHLSMLAISFLVLFLTLSLFVERPFCNYLCTNGIEYALPSFTRIFTIKRNPKTCVSCKACDKTCPMNIQISTTQELRNLQCINCFKCQSSCPIENTLTYGRADNLIDKIKKKLKKS